MPNHIMNKIKLEGSILNLLHLRETIEWTDLEDGEEGKYYLDFKKIIPRPDGTNMDITSTNCISDLNKMESSLFNNDKDVKEWVSDVKNYCFKDGKISEDHIKEVFDALRNTILTGCSSWYEWNTKNWGTKWNAYSQENKNDELVFQTAWGHPLSVVKKLSLMFPEVKLNVKFADEDYGSNYGAYSIKAGVMIEDNTESIKDPNKFACELHGQNYEDYLKECEE